ncbi:uncharacterized protein BJ212DRAFT_1295810 [Suillus subaureus]|uniref:Uncharacterized protein n=1 Tax=Suillus subaureus TaxID=48587 RepID=A0A9P7JIN1_9AGAM|nr:uncharacterized protein BJ212DRAFT_1295810 [Suillus subaureus]KAG1824698.1 hypothetical protein BJ212DRAFT_1295810 [Suillus subaureus]
MWTVGNKDMKVRQSAFKARSKHAKACDIASIKQRWVHNSEGAVPQPKGERASLMTMGGSILQMGSKVLVSSSKMEKDMMDTLQMKTFWHMLQKQWTSLRGGIHTKTIPSATWGVPRTIKDVNGNNVLGLDGKPLKEKIPMAEARLPNGDPQPLYFPDGHSKAGYFKGMAQILVEQGYTDAPKLCAKCKDFKCPNDQTLCHAVHKVY